MASLRLYLDKPLKTRPTRTVYLRYKVPSGVVTFYPYPLVDTTEAKWDARAQRIKGTSLGVQKLNGRLGDLRQEVEKMVTRLHLELGHDPAPAMLRAALPHLSSKNSGSGGIGKAPGTWQAGDPVGMLSLPELVRYVARLRTQELSKASLRLLESLASCLLTFKPADDAAWLLGALTPLRLEEWRQWLVTPAAAGGLYVSNSTANERCSQLRAVLAYARRKGSMFRAVITEDHLRVLSSRFKKVSEERAALAADELMRFYHTPLPPGTPPTELLVRDLYCLSWCTSLRQSDLMGLQAGNIVWHENEKGETVPYALDTTSFKSLKATLLPLNPLAAEIVLRWLNRDEVNSFASNGHHLRRIAERNWPAGRLFPVVTLHRHQALRDLWDRLGLFTEEVEVIRLSGGHQQRSFVKRNRLLTLHTARHGFGNHMAASNMPIEDAALLMGHKSIKTTSIYYHRPEALALSRAREALQHLPGLKPTNEPD